VRGAVAQRAQVRGEPGARGVDVEEAHVRGARVAVAVHDEGRHERERARRGGRARAVGPEPQRQLALEDVEQVVVAAVDVEVGAVAARGEPRPRRVQRVGLADDLDAVRPSRR
jgi:hypothetical protein